MDASAFVTKDEWEDILTKNGCDEVTVFLQPVSTVCPVSSDPFYIVSYYIK